MLFDHSPRRDVRRGTEVDDRAVGWGELEHAEALRVLAKAGEGTVGAVADQFTCYFRVTIPQTPSISVMMNIFMKASPIHSLPLSPFQLTDPRHHLIQSRAEAEGKAHAWTGDAHGVVWAQFMAAVAAQAGGQVDLRHAIFILRHGIWWAAFAAAPALLAGVRIDFRPGGE